MIFTVTQARALAAELTAGADRAESAGQPSFDFSSSLIADAQDALNQLQTDLKDSP